MRTKTTTKKTEVLAEDRQRIQGIRDDDIGSSGSTMGPVDWQLQRSVNFPYYCVANSNTVLSLSHRFLILILFSSDYFFSSFTARKTISTEIM